LIYFTTSQGTPLVARQNERTTLRTGDAVGVQVNTDTAHVFDAHGRIARTGQTHETPTH
jgi:multiple sugar transport system ATP-binding protein